MKIKNASAFSEAEALKFTSDYKQSFFKKNLPTQSHQEQTGDTKKN
ncbi:hypothetical protein L0Z72_04580 [candidate division KSB1 bacterium]|nr:hypothetical protein [candidate division KSB1 bacterium]